MSIARDIHVLRRMLADFGAGESEGDRGGFASGAPGLDAALGQGLSRGALHEIFAAGIADAAAAAGFVAGLCLRASPGASPIVWVRQAFGQQENGGLYGHGLAEMGLDPQRLVLVAARDAAQVLRASLEAMRCNGLGAVVIEPWGNPGVLDLTASRRLVLAGEKSGVTAFMLRVGAAPQPSAATSRWQVRAAPSAGDELALPGNPAFEITLMRHRAGLARQAFNVEWDSEKRVFCEPALSGGVVPPVFDRPAAAPPRQNWRRAG